MISLGSFFSRESAPLLGIDVSSSSVKLVELSRNRSGDLVLERIDPAAGRSRWTARVAMAASDGGEVLARQLALRVADGLVLVEGAAAVVVDAGTGTPRD